VEGRAAEAEVLGRRGCFRLAFSG